MVMSVGVQIIMVRMEQLVMKMNATVFVPVIANTFVGDGSETLFTKIDVSCI